MRFIKDYGFEAKTKKNTSTKGHFKNVCSPINVTNPLISLSGETLTYERADYFETLNESHYLSQFTQFLERYTDAIVNAVDFKLIDANQLPNLQPVTITEARESLLVLRNLLSNVPVKLIEQLMQHVSSAKKDLIAGGVPSSLIEEFDTVFKPEFDFAYDNAEIVFETPVIDGGLLVNISNFRSNSKAASSLISLLCKGKLFDIGSDAAHFNYMESGEAIRDKKTIAWVKKVLKSPLDIMDLKNQIAWIKLVLPLVAHIEVNYNIEISESLSMNFSDLDIGRLMACDYSYVDEVSNSRISQDFDIESLVNFFSGVLYTIASFSYLDSQFQSADSFSKLNNKKAESAQILEAIYTVASEATDNEYLEVANEDHMGVRTFVLPEYININNEDAYRVVDEVYNHAYELDEIALNFKIELTESHMTAIKNILINSYCMNFLAFLSERPRSLDY